MKLTETLDVRAPAEFTFSELSDYEAIERLAIQRGVSLRRTDRIDGPAAGMAWLADWEAMGRELRTRLSLTAYEPPERLVIESETSGIAGRMQIDVVALGPSLSRILMETEIRAVTLKAKVLMQPIRLARGRIEQRIAGRVGDLASRIEGRWRARSAQL